MLRADEKASDGLEPLLSIEEARTVLGISTASMYRLLGRGELDVVEVGGRRLIEPEALRRFIAACRRRGQREEVGAGSAV